MLDLQKKRQSEAVKALTIAYQDFNYGELEYVDKALFHLRIAEQNLNNIIAENIKNIKV